MSCLEIQLTRTLGTIREEPGCDSLVENKARLNINHIDKFDFLEAYPHARTEAFKMENIGNSFAASGLIPFNLERVFGQLNIQLKTPT